MPPHIPIIVTGAGRSGTSAVARVLHESGLSMGRQLAPPADHNPLGFYEELPVMAVNDRIIMDCGVDRWGTWPSRAEALAAAEKYAAEMARLAAGLTEGGWKDPRFCLTLEAWLPRLTAPPRVVVCLRSPAAQVESGLRPYGVQWIAQARDGLSQLWRHQNERLLAVIEEFALEATCVEYDELLARPREVVARLSKFVGRPLDDRYVEAGLRHHVAPVPARFAALYERVRALGEANRHNGNPPAVSPRRRAAPGDGRFARER